jgi:hypothetical protein
MPLSALTDKSHEPTEEDLRGVLGKSYEVWTRLIDAVAEQIGPVSQTWGFTSKSTGWGTPASAERSDHSLHDSTDR